MNKFAHLVKTAEVRGVMAYLVDSEMVKVASQEDFDALVDVVSQSVDGEYDLNTVLTKTAEILDPQNLEKVSSALGEVAMSGLGAGIGGIRASNLSKEEAEALREHYGLEADASLGWRNAGRGVAGGVLGGALGSLAGAGVGAGIGAALKRGNLTAIRAGMEGGKNSGGLAGILAGHKLMTDKYSRGNKVLKKNLGE